MDEILVVHHVDGRIQQVMGYTSDAQLQKYREVFTGMEVVVVPKPATPINDGYYVTGGALTPRPTLTIAVSEAEISADAETAAVIEGIPAGAIVTTGSETLEADGTSLEFITDIPGEHSIRIDHFPWISEEVTIHAI